MNILSDRAKRRQELVRLARDSKVHVLAEKYLSDYRVNLEHLQEGQQIEKHVPVGKEKFLDWLKETVQKWYPDLLGVIENDRMLKELATQVADTIAKSDTKIKNPMRDYPKDSEPTYLMAQYSPAKPKVQAPYGRPQEFFRMNEDREQIIPKDLEQGLQNQNLMNDLHPIKPFLSKMKDKDELRIHKKKQPEERPYNVFEGNEALISPSAPNNDPKTTEESKKEASIARLTRKAQQNKKAQQLFAPTVMTSRQCPDHPGQQLSRVEDAVRQCPLDGKVYDYSQGFKTEDGEHHNGGTVQAQSSIPPGSIIVRLDKQAAKITAPQDSPKVHAFLWQVLQHLPDSHERSVLNYKFQHNVSLQESIQKFEEMEMMQKHQDTGQPQGQAQPETQPVNQPPVVAGIAGLTRRASDK